MSEEERRTMDKRNLTTPRQSNNSANSRDVSNVRNSPSISRNYQGLFNRSTEIFPTKKFSSNQKDSTKYSPIDKRPKPRGNYSIGTKETLKGEENNSQILNFFFEDNRGWIGRKNNQLTSQIGKKYSSHGPVFNKEVFLQANCQFVVKHDGDYTMHQYDPDLLANWESIEQVKIFSHEDIVCPICLYPPSAGKITRCGHIYCWPCILHYLSLGDKTWRKCPICYEAIHAKELLSVKVEIRKEITVGQKLTMKLMCKWRGEVVVAPKSLCLPIKDRSILCSVNDNLIQSYSKLLLSDDDYVNNLIETEREQLIVLLALEEENSLESSYIEMALKNLEERSARRRSKCLQNSSPPATDKLNTEIKFATKPSKIYLSAFDDIEGTEQLNDKNQNDINTEFMSKEPISLMDELVKTINSKETENQEHGLKDIKSASSDKFAKKFDNQSNDKIEESCMGDKHKNVVASKTLPKFGKPRNEPYKISESGNLFDFVKPNGDNEKFPEFGNLLDFEKPGIDFEKFGESDYCFKNMKCLDETVIFQEEESSAESLEEVGLKLKEGGCMTNSKGEYKDTIEDKIKSGGPKDAFYFYQASDGQHLYMHPLNICCLKQEYGGDLSQCPNEVTATVLEIESHFMTQETRRRMRYLNHLPLTCEFQLIELDLKPPIISQSTLSLMSEEIRSRAEERKRREKRDKRRAERYQRDENKKMGIDPYSKIVRSDFYNECFQEKHDSLCDIKTEEVDSGSMCESTPSELNATPSFAQMLKLGKAKPSNESMASSNSEEKSSKDEIEGQEGIVPEYRASFGAAFDEQLEQRLAAFEKLDNESEPKIGGKSFRKKKKVPTATLR